jgi:hypothetical protein
MNKNIKGVTMVRVATLLLVLCGNLSAGEPEIETVSDSEFAFDINDSRISVEIRDRVLRGKKDIRLPVVTRYGLARHSAGNRLPCGSWSVRI